MVEEQRGSLDWARIQAKIRCSLPSAELRSLTRVHNPKLWSAFEGPVREFRDAGGYVRADQDVTGVREVWSNYCQHDAIVYKSQNNNSNCFTTTVRSLPRVHIIIYSHLVRVGIFFRGDSQYVHTSLVPTRAFTLG